MKAKFFTSVLGELNQPQSEKTSIDYYLSLARNGYFPLFFNEWIKKSHSLNTKSVDISKEELSRMFEEIKHNNVDRKRMAISSMPEEKRSKFIHAFMNTLEKEILNEKRKH